MSMYLGSQHVTPVVSVKTGGDTPISDAVRFFDYDGTILYTYTAAQFLALSAMPANPSHTGLVAQGWNWTLADAQAYVTDWECLDIGQMYTTTSGDTEIDIKLQKGRLSPYLSLAVNGTVSIDWGDSSTPDTVTGTSLTSAKRTQHTYATPGNYTIKISIDSGSWNFYSTSTYGGVLSANSSTQNINKTYSVMVQAVRIGDGNIGLREYAFACCYALKYVTIPSSITSMTGNSLFESCYNLKTITVPITSSNLSFYSSFAQNCYNLMFCSFSIKATSLPSQAFGSCYRLRAVYIPSQSSSNGCVVSYALQIERYIDPKRNLKIVNQYNYNIANALSGSSIGEGQFSYILTLRQATIPNSITSMSSSSFYFCIHLEDVTLPSNNLLTSSSNFANCFSLQSINLLDTFNTIGSYNINCWYSFSSPLTLPSSLSSIPTSNVQTLYCIPSVSMSNTVTSIGNYFGSNCYCLSEVTLSSSLQTIGNNVCQYCYNLSEITIPATVTSIGNQSFQYCYALKEIHVLATSPPSLGGSNVFRDLPSDCTIYVPTASLATYQSASNWSTYASQMVGE